MTIVYKHSFTIRLERQLAFIAKDNVPAARKFRRELIRIIKDIPKNPLIHRRSIYFNDSSVRDLIYKGYTVVFRINKDVIEVFGFVYYQEFPTDR